MLGRAGGGLAPRQAGLRAHPAKQALSSFAFQGFGHRIQKFDHERCHFPSNVAVQLGCGAPAKQARSSSALEECATKRSSTPGLARSCWICRGHWI